MSSSETSPNNSSPPAQGSNVLNINIGVLGHVDSGKTSLVRALSTSLSTAALDKNPQSQARGITLDLGFSAFTVPMPEHLSNSIAQKQQQYDSLQFTLVDCPGHASLIRTIIGGAQIIDMMLLVIDANKGIQTQTAESIVIGEITTDKMIIVLNKIDTIPIEEREAKLEKMKKRLGRVFAATKFANAPMIGTAAAVGAGSGMKDGGKDGWKEVGKDGGKESKRDREKDKEEGSQVAESIGINELISLIRSSVTVPNRNFEAPLYFAIDHCFPIKGHGTVLTGTVLSGRVTVNSSIEIPELQITKKVKSMQMFKKSVKVASQGDRVGLCVTNLDPKLIERGVAAAPGSVPLLHNILVMVKKVRIHNSQQIP